MLHVSPIRISKPELGSSEIQQPSCKTEIFYSNKTFGSLGCLTSPTLASHYTFSAPLGNRFPQLEPYAKVGSNCYLT